MKTVEPRSALATPRRDARRIGRRRLLAAGGAAALAAGAGSRATAQAVTVPMGIWGGVMIDTVRAVAEPQFTAKNPNVKFEFNIRGATDAYSRILVSQDRPGEAGGMWNDTFSALGAKANMFVPFDDALVPERKGLIKAVQPGNGLGIAFAVQPFGIAYNPKFVEKPTSWLDLFNPKYKGKVALIDNFYDHYVMLSRVMGKDEHQIEIAFDEWGKHKDQVGVFTNTFPQLQDLVDKGEMWLGPHWGGFATGAMRSGLNIAFAWPKEGCTQATVIAHANRNMPAEASQTAQRFMNTWLTPEYQGLLLEKAGLSPTNPAVKIPPELAKLDGIITEERLATNKIIQYDYAHVGANLAKMKRLFSEKLR